tara:strand:- start:938 stop:1099 length:162 start_codon:yes stop_codon:yes gene_type:complete
MSSFPCTPIEKLPEGGHSFGQHLKPKKEMYLSPVEEMMDVLLGKGLGCLDTMI